MRRSLCFLLLSAVLLLPGPGRADPRIDWEEWYGGDVHVQLWLGAGPGCVVQAGEPVQLELRVDEDAYVLVYAIDTQGYVRLLYPRFWEDDGWIEGGHRVRLSDASLACRPERCGMGDGIVYVQAVASPLPFDWDDMGLRVEAGSSAWWRDGDWMRVHGDPLLGFNDVNRCLFRDWDEAVFAADYTWFHVGHRCEHPGYLCSVCAGRGHGYHEPWLRVNVDLVWVWERGRRFCRPVYRPRYIYAGDRRRLRHADEVGWRDRRHESQHREASRAPEYREPARRLHEDRGREPERRRETRGLRVPDRPERSDATPLRRAWQAPSPAVDRSSSPAVRDRQTPTWRQMQPSRPPAKDAAAAHSVQRVEVPMRGATPPAPGSDAPYEAGRRRATAPARTGDESRARDLARPVPERSASAPAAQTGRVDEARKRRRAD